MTPTEISALADAVAERLCPAIAPVGWPEDRVTISEPEFAELVGLGSDFVRELRMAGELAHTKAGRRILYSAANVTEFLEAHKQGGKKENGNGR